MTWIKSRAILQGHRSDVWSMRWSSDGVYLATASGDGTIRIWNAPWKAVKWKLIVKRPRSLSWSPNDRTLAFIDDDKDLIVFDADGAGAPKLLNRGEDRFVSWSPNGQSLFTITRTGKLVRRDLDGKRLSSVTVPIKDYGPIVEEFSISPHGPLLAAAINPESGDSFIRLWELDKLTPKHDLDWHVLHIYSVAWSPTAELLVSSSRDKAICVWNVRTGTPYQILEGHTDDPIDLDFSHDGRLLASRDFGGVICFWRTDVWALVARAKTPAGTGGGIAFHPREPILATRGHMDEVVHLWTLDYDQLASAHADSTSELLNLDRKMKDLEPTHDLTDASGIRVFLCHASEDSKAVRKLWKRLRAIGINPWLDKIDLLPGVELRLAIEQALRGTDAVIVCLSENSVNKHGFVQREIALALDIAAEKPENTIFLLPIRLTKCDVPLRLQRWKYVDLFERGGFNRLVQALRQRKSAVQKRVETEL